MYILSGDIADSIRALIENNITILVGIVVAIASFNIFVFFIKKSTRF